MFLLSPSGLAVIDQGVSPYRRDSADQRRKIVLPALGLQNFHTLAQRAFDKFDPCDSTTALGRVETQDAHLSTNRCIVLAGIALFRGPL